MWVVLLFGVLLFAAVLVSERARTSVLSTSVLFVLAGVAVGPTLLGWIRFESATTAVGNAAELALFTILFIDGAHLRGREIADAWRLPGRALLIGIPLTIIAIGLLAHLVLGLSWLSSLLLGAILSPTDPVLVRAILEQEAVPVRLRRLLSVESGLNDGLAVPPITVLLAMLGSRDAHPIIAVLQAAGGIVVGASCGALVLIERIRWLRVARAYRPLAGVAIGCTALAACKLTDANELLAAFSAGITMASLQQDFSGDFTRMGEPISEAVKLAALLVFGLTLTLHLDVVVIAFAAITLLAARPIALLFAFVGGGLSRAEWAASAWFGPKGFASLFFAVLVVRAGIPDAERLYSVVGIVVLLSVLVHASTDSLIARAFGRRSSALDAEAG